MRKLIPFFIGIIIFSFQCPCQGDSIFYGIATFYSDWFEGRTTSAGETFRQANYTAAHMSLKHGTFLKVTNRSIQQAVIVKVNDRCPKRGVLDLSKSAAKHLGILHKGTTKIKIEILGEEGLSLWNAQKFLFKTYFDYFEKRKEKLIDTLLKTPEFFQENVIEKQMFFGYSLQIAYAKNVEQIKSILLLLPSYYIPYIKAEEFGKKGYNVILGPFFTIQALEKIENEVKISFTDTFIRENKPYNKVIFSDL